MKTYNIFETLDSLKVKYEARGNLKKNVFSNLKAINNADSNSLVFIGEERNNKEELSKHTKSGIIITNQEIEITDSSLSNKCFIIVENPRLVVTRIGNLLFRKKVKYDIHSTSVISKEANISKNVYVGPFCSIKNCTIEEGTVIHENCHIDDNVKIGKNVIIHPGCVIGTEAVGHIKNENNVYENFPQLGGVIIEDGVEIFPNAKVFRGALSDTIIQSNSIIDTHVIVGHNVKIGSNTIITARTVIGGSTIIGDNVWISLGSVLSDNIKISNNVHIGPGAVVIKDIPEGAKVVSKPAFILPNN